MAGNKKINIVMFSMSSYSEWEKGVENRNYHILQNLIKDERVSRIVMVDYLPHTFRRLIRNSLDNLIKRPKYKIISRNFHSISYNVNEKLTVYSSIISKFSKQKFYFELKDFLRKIGVEDYVVWSYYPLDTGYFGLLRPQLFIFDAVDNWTEHPSYNARFKKQLKENYRIIDEKSDLIFILSSEQRRMFSHEEKIHLFLNGVDLKHFQQEYPIVKRDIGDLPKPIIGYCGTVQDRFDVDLYEFLVSSNPDKNFVIVGPIWYSKIKKRLLKHPNVHLLGRVPYEEVPMYIQQFDIGIIPHKPDDFSRFTNSMKIYEYLSCGKPVITTEQSNIDDFKEVVYIANDKLEFNQLLNKLSAEDDNLSQKRLELVKEHSWLKRVDKMLDLIIQKM